MPSIEMPVVSGSQTLPQQEFAIGSAVFDGGITDALSAWREAFAQQGVDAPKGIRGGFAVALKPAPGKAFLAVDPFAIQNVCYRVVGQDIFFAERADALTGSTAELDPQAIYDYFYFHVIPSPRTIFKDVYRLPAGHYALFENGKLTVAPYWQPEFVEDVYDDFDKLKGQFRSIIETSVREQLDGRPTACFLSGGTDSSTVAGMYRKVTGQPAEAYSIGFEAEGYDEMEYARLAARHFGCRHHEYYVTPKDLVAEIAHVSASYDQPFGNSSALPGYICAKAAKADGFDKMLAGDGGDELFGGNSRYAKQRVFDWYNLFPGFLRKGVMEPVAPLFDGIPGIKKVASYIEQAKVPMPTRMYMYSLLTRLGENNIFTPGFLGQVDLQAPAKHQQGVWDAARAHTLINRMLAFDWRYTLAENDLPKVVGTTRLAQVDVGFPLLDERLVRFSLSLHPDYKLKGLKLRWFFKEALRGFLPDEIITKKKHGFGLPFGVWATRDPALRKLAEDSLHSLAQRGIVRAEFIETLLKEHLPAYPGYYGEMVWIMMMLEQWLAAHLPNYRLI